MIFTRFAPAPGLEKIIDCYWIIRDHDTRIQKQKIIPDGFTEIIFHKGAPYRICLNEEWKTQSTILFAGQISRHFFLENTGTSYIIGIKLQPTAFTHLYQLDAYTFSNNVADISSTIPELTILDRELDSAASDDKKIDLLNHYFSNRLLNHPIRQTAADKAIEIIFKEHGVLQVASICATIGVGGRQLENLFKKQVGLSPKLFARIVRFSYIFELVQQNNQSWCGLAYEAAYYDQSHFIRNFKNFTGENPADYAFNEKTMANFFLNKK